MRYDLAHRRYHVYEADDVPMSTGAKIGLGAGVVAIAAGVGYLLWSKKAAAAPAQRPVAQPALKPTPAPVQVSSPAPAPRPVATPTVSAPPPAPPQMIAVSHPASPPPHAVDPFGGATPPFDPSRLTQGGVDMQAQPSPVQSGVDPSQLSGGSSGSSSQSALDYLKNAAQSAADLITGS